MRLEGATVRKVVPYEHRGAQYRGLSIRSQVDATNVAALYRSERDVWLRKILAGKLLEAAPGFDVGIPVDELNEVMRCRIG
jgi:hypothetical protein